MSQSLTSPRRSDMLKKKVKHKQSGDITEEQSGNEIRRQRISSKKNADKIYKIAMLVKFHV